MSESTRKIIVNAATSADGFIARADGGIEWLTSLPKPPGVDFISGDVAAFAKRLRSEAGKNIWLMDGPTA